MSSANTNIYPPVLFRLPLQQHEICLNPVFSIASLTDEYLLYFVYFKEI